MNEREPQPNSSGQPSRVASACPQTPIGPDTEPSGYRPLDTHNALTGRDLRYVLTDYISRGYGTVARMVQKLAIDGYTVWGRASKVVSDALRWEIRNGRVQRVRRGIYAIARVPKSTYYRIRAHAESLFLAPHIVAIRRDLPCLGGSTPTPPPDRHWREWRKSPLVPG